MVKQYRDMTILLTRPAAQSLRFASELQQALPDVPIIISPLMVPDYLNPPIPPDNFNAVILVSVAAVEAAKRISATGAKLPALAYCVGNRTAAAATVLGFQALSAQGDAADLLAMIKADQPTGRLLFLRGRDSSGDIAKNLLSARIETVSLIVYQQKGAPLNPGAVDLLQGNQPVILPVFSVRSAGLVQAEITRISATAPLWVAALSPAIAAAFDPKTLAGLGTAHHPDSNAMILAVRGLVSSLAAP